MRLDKYKLIIFTVQSALTVYTLSPSIKTAAETEKLCLFLDSKLLTHNQYILTVNVLILLYSDRALKATANKMNIELSSK